MSDSYTTVGRLLGLGAEKKVIAKTSISAAAEITRRRTILAEDVFQSLLTLERRRSERSRKRFVLMLMTPKARDMAAEKSLHRTLVPTVAAATRETDLIGWYRKESVLGIIFTEIGEDEKTIITETLRAKIEAALADDLGSESAARVGISIHVFPEDWDREHSNWIADAKLYPELQPDISRKQIPLAIKRAIDIIGSSILLLLMFPVLAAIAVGIKLSSKGPVLFEQERLGQLGKRFKCLKFRTMYTNCDSKIHQDYIQQFIAGENSGTQDSSKPTVYKISNDPRVTAIGRLLRKTSLDELPQFWNVVRGEMSLVGPRPPLAYEFEIYDVWHRRRVLELRPGVTGLWQVSGRSRTKFDDMVRLDLRYSQTWSLALDFKILLATPKAVFTGEGAY